MKRLPILLLTILLAGPALLAAQDAAPAAAEPEEDMGQTAKVKFDTTWGEFVFELYVEKAPISSVNFLRYARDGFYNGTIIHRVEPNFVIQGGGFTEDGKKKAEGMRDPIENEWRNGLKNKRGTLSMARIGGQANSATSQYFVNLRDNSALDVPRDGAAYAVFGRVAKGMDIVDKIAASETAKQPGLPFNAPVTPVVFKSAEILDGFDVDALIKKAEAEKKAMEEAAKKAEETYVAEQIAKAEKEGGSKVVTTDSGLRYVIVKEGEGESPTVNSTVTMHYRGTLTNGKEFDSSYSRNQPLKYGLKSLIKGWQEGVPKMKKGGKALLVIPGDLGYGKRGAPPDIPPDATLIFEVELLDFQ